MTNYCSTCQNYVENDPCAVCEGTENNHVYYDPNFRKWNVKDERKSGGSRNMTNGDSIRAMTDVELACWYCRGRSCERCQYNSSRGCTIHEWLRQEVKEDK